MKMKQVLAGAVATAFVAPVAALAAIDDQGMQYVSASEGFSGSFRVDVLIDTDEENTDVTSGTNSLRLFTAGDLDLGGGMQSTYSMEIRGGNDKEETNVSTHFYELGLKGPFGHVTFGRLTQVAFRLTPGASLAFERGTERASPGSDPGPNGIRYESPVINGFQFGASGVLNGKGGPDGSLDEYSLGVKYTLPIGLEVGAGYELVDVTATGTTYGMVSYDHDDDESTPNITAPGYGDTAAIYTGDAGSTTGLTDSTETSSGVWAGTGAKMVDSMNGFRFGARYGQDNWLVAYEYRGYDGYKPVDIAGYGPQDIAVGTGAAANPFDLVKGLDALIVNGDAGLEYAVHAVGAQAKVDRVTMSAGYSMEENTYEGSLVQSGGDITLERDTIAIDAAYALGSRSHMVIGWRKHDFSSVVNPFAAANLTVNGSKDVSMTYLFYRVDF